MESLLKLEHVTICYNGEPVVHDVDLELNKGEILGVVGESGSGKSTIIKAIMGLLGNEGMVTEGDIWYKGKNVVDMPEKELRRLLGPEIAMVFQDSGAALCPIRTVGDQIYESMREHERISRKECAERAVRMMAKIGLKDGERVLQSYPFELSGGMNQRVGICISMLQNPSLLLADEPTSALDVTIQKQIMELLKRLQKESRMAVLLITHDMGVVSHMADRVLVMYAGQIVEEAEAEELFRHPSHPYTRALLSAIPTTGDSEDRKLSSIPGMVPENYDTISGCRFADRCPYTRQECHQRIGLREISKGHTVRCILQL